jgi:DNA-binding NarL/FixJ family response regulator
VLVAEDNAVNRKLAEHLLQRRGHRAVMVENGREALDALGSEHVDLVLMDLQMPDMDGVAATRRIRRDHDGIEVLILTTYDTDADITRAVAAGATGYLLKDASREELMQAIRLAARGESVLSPKVASRVLGRMRAPAEEALSTREVEVLLEVADGLSNKEVGRMLHISEATVKTHLLHIFAKLGVDDRTAAVTAALERGIIRLDSPRASS